MSSPAAHFVSAGERNTSKIGRSTIGQSALARTKLDWAIIASLLAMGALNLYVMADQFGPTKAYAAPVRSHSCGAPLA